MNILYQFNEKYVPYAGVSMASLLHNNEAAESICIYILGENLAPESVNKLKILVESYNRSIVFIETDELIGLMKELNMPTYRGSYAANMRLFVEELVDGQDRLLYLDADTIVVSDLGEMYNLPIKTVGMVYDTLGCAHKYEIGLGKEDGYYNSGVILYDLKRWKDNQYTQKIVDHVMNVRSNYPSPDQDLLNVVLRGDITPLPISCNYQPHLRDYPYEMFMRSFNPEPFYGKQEVIEADKSPVIYHAFRYIGEFPWNKGNYHPFNVEFDKYLAITPWSDYVKATADNGIVIRVEKLLYKALPKGLFLWIFKLMHGGFYRKANKLSKKNKISSKM